MQFCLLDHLGKKNTSAQPDRKTAKDLSLETVWENTSKQPS